MLEYFSFNRKEWALLRNSVPLTLNEKDLKPLLGFNEDLSLDEVSTIFLPLVRLINYSIESYNKKSEVINKFLGKQTPNIPFIIGIAGSVAVGKSTTARILQALLKSWPIKRNVDLITTDGFLYDLNTLIQKNILHKKGFPISYNIRLLIEFLSNIKSGKKNLEIPIYSHKTYDIVKDKYQIIKQPEIIILEGLNVLQHNMDLTQKNIKDYIYVSDFLDFSIFIDAKENLLKTWFLERFVKLREQARNDPDSYLHSLTLFDDDTANNIALKVWEDINAKNLKENILPTKKRAKLILEKGEDHLIKSIKLRK